MKKRLYMTLTRSQNMQIQTY